MNNPWNSDSAQYAALLRKSFELGEQHARGIMIGQMAVQVDNADSEAYESLQREVEALYAGDAPFDACYTAGFAVAISMLAGSGR